MSDGCCCGATKSNPCVCMKKGITKCSKSEPKCPCYAEKDKKLFEKAWSVAKSEYDEYGTLTDEAMASRKEAWLRANPGAEMSECQRLALEHDGDPCILCGGDGDWCWNAGLPVNEDGSLDYSMMQGYDEKGRPLKKSDDAKIARWLKNTGNAGTPYDDYDWDGKVLTVYSGDDVERYTLADLKEAGAL